MNDMSTMNTVVRLAMLGAGGLATGYLFGLLIGKTWWAAKKWLIANKSRTYEITYNNADRDTTDDTVFFKRKWNVRVFVKASSWQKAVSKLIVTKFDCVPPENFCIVSIRELKIN